MDWATDGRWHCLGQFEVVIWQNGKVEMFGLGFSLLHNLSGTEVTNV